MSLAVKPLPDDPAKLKALLLKERSANENLKQQIHSLLEALRLEKHRLYGKSSEKAPDQSELFDEADTCLDETDRVDDGAPVVEPKPTPKNKRPTRKPFPPELPRVRHVIELSEEERQCSCGCTLVEIGEDISEQVDIIPVQVQVTQHVRKKYACKNCDDTIKIAAKANVLLPKSIASGNTMAYIITSKYVDGLPLYRLSSILERYGIELSRQTLSESVLKVAEKIEPLISHIKQQLMKSSVLFMDETRVPVLKQFHTWLLKSQQQVPPKTALGKAVNYTLEYWPG